jgi:hypothetical protein
VNYDIIIGIGIGRGKTFETQDRHNSFLSQNLQLSSDSPQSSVSKTSSVTNSIRNGKISKPNSYIIF